MARHDGIDGRPWAHNREARRSLEKLYRKYGAEAVEAARRAGVTQGAGSLRSGEEFIHAYMKGRRDG